jgi:hypothetical protein
LEPYWRFLEESRPAFRESAQRLYGARVIHVPSRASTHGFNNHFDATWPMTFWTAGAAWAAQFMYDYWRYTGDEKFLRQADECAQIVEWLANSYWGPNLVSTHDPGRFFNTDISGGLPHVIHRMLVDSRPGRVEWLPALPADWHEGRSEGIRARGNIEIRSLEWSRDSLRAVLRSADSQTIELVVPGESAPRKMNLPAGQDVTVQAKRPPASSDVHTDQ